MKRRNPVKLLCAVLCICMLLPAMAVSAFAAEKNLPAIVEERPDVVHVEASPVTVPTVPETLETLWEFDFANMNGTLKSEYESDKFGKVTLSSTYFTLGNEGMALSSGKKSGAIRFNEPTLSEVTPSSTAGVVGNSHLAAHTGTLMLRAVVRFDKLPTVTASSPNENILSFITWEHTYYKAGSTSTTTEYARFLCVDENGYLHNNARVKQSDTQVLVAGQDAEICIILQPEGTKCRYHLFLDGEYVFTSSVPISKGATGIVKSNIRFFDTRRQYDATLKEVSLVTVDPEYSIDGFGNVETTDWFGYQTTKVGKGAAGIDVFNLRLISLLNRKEGYKEFGYEVTATYRKNGEIVFEPSKVIMDQNTYAELDQHINGQVVMWKPEEVGSLCATTAVIRSIDAAAEDYELRVRPFAVREDGLKIYGKSQYMAYEGLDANGEPRFTCSDSAASQTILAKEDTYVRFGSYEKEDYFEAKDLQYKWNTAKNDLADAIKTSNTRFAFILFDLTELKEGWSNYYLNLNYSSSQGTLGTDVFAVEDWVLYDGTLKGLTGALVKKEADLFLSDDNELVTSVDKTGSVRADVTEYVKAALKKGQKNLLIRVEYNREDVVEGKETGYAYAAMHSIESGKGPSIIGSGNFTYETNVDTYQNNGYEPWGYAEMIVEDWYENIWDIYARDYGYSIMSGTEDTDSKAYVAEDYAETIGIRSGGGYNNIAARTVDTIKNFNALSESPEYDGYGGNAADGGKYYNDPAYASKVNGTKGYFGTYYDDVNNRWWFITPEGNRYLALGICTVSFGSTVAQKSLALTQYGDQDGATWTSNLLNKIGLNTSTGSSISTAVIPEDNYVISTHTGVGMIGSYGSNIGTNASIGGSTVFANNNTMNVFDPDFVTYAYSKAESVTSAHKESAYMLGWTSDNEIPASGDMLVRYLTLSPTVDETVVDDPATRDNEKDIETLNNRNGYSYAVAWTWLCKMTGKDNPTVEDARKGSVQLQMGGTTKEVSYLDLFRGFVYYRYYSIASDAIKTADPNHLYLGCRELGGNYQCEEVMRVAGAFCDSVTLNLYLGANPPAVTIDNIHKWTGKPAYVTEFYAKSDGVDTSGKQSGTQSYSIWEVVYPALTTPTSATYYTIDTITTTVNGNKAKDTYYQNGTAIWAVEYTDANAKAGTQKVSISAYAASKATTVSAYFIADGETTYRDTDGKIKTVPEIVLTNNRGAGKRVRSQDDRGVYYETFALKMLESGFCVGWSWYRYQDNDMPLFYDDKGNLLYFNDWDTYEDWDINPNLTLIHKGENTDQSNLDANKGIVNNAMEEYTEFTSHISNIANNLYALADHFDERRN